MEDVLLHSDASTACKVFAPPPADGYDRRGMRRALGIQVGLFVALLVALLVVIASVGSVGCGERRPRPIVPQGTLHPAAPPPPGSIALVGPLQLEAIDVVRSEIGWDRDLVRASRIVHYDVVLTQERGTCPKDQAPASIKDAIGCSGAASLPESCTHETIRARLEVAVRYAIDVQQRCAGDAAPYAVSTSGDPKPALATAGAACFRNKNKFKPESGWTSLYALTELEIDERLEEARTRAPRMLAALLSGNSAPIFCRDDAAFLDGAPGALQGTPADVPPAASFVPQILGRAPLSGEQGAVGLTNQTWRTEQSLWEQCHAPGLESVVVAQERCQLLRQLDRFVRDVEDAARPETPKGAPSASASSSAKKEGP